MRAIIPQFSVLQAGAGQSRQTRGVHKHFLIRQRRD